MTNSPLPLGIDVSNYQGAINWMQVADDGVEFAGIKATEGIAFHDGYFANNWAQAKVYNIPRIAYHYAKPDYSAANDEATYFIDYILNNGGIDEGDILALDMEEGTGDLSGWTQFFVEVVESLVGFKPLLYSRKNFIEEHNLNTPELAACGLWLASYSDRFPATLLPWPNIAFWQYSNAGRIPGITGDVDLNRFNGTVNRIPLYGKPKDTPAPLPQLEIKTRLNELLAQTDALLRALKALRDDVANQQ